MKRYLNEKGSLPLVVLIAFILLISITSLAGLLSTEKVNIRFSINKDVKRVYDKEAMIELTKNILYQQVLSKKWNIIEGEEVLNESDFSVIEELVNEEALPLAGVEGKIYISKASSNYQLDEYCRNEADEGVRYVCLNEKLSVAVEVVLEKDEDMHSIVITLKDFVVEPNEEKDAVILRKNER